MSYDLSDSELLLLDGKCNDKLQAEINRLKERIAIRETLNAPSDAIGDFVAKIVALGRQNGRLRFHFESMKHCEVCKAGGEYYPRKRTSSKGLRGTPDYDKPKLLHGVGFADAFISFKYYPANACCNTCWEQAKPVLLKALDGLKIELPQRLTGEPPKYLRFDNRECTSCGWTGHEGELWKLPAIMDGYYHGECPKCEARNVLFNDVIKIKDGWQVIPASEERQRKPMSWELQAAK